MKCLHCGHENTHNRKVYWAFGDFCEVGDCLCKSFLRSDPKDWPENKVKIPVDFKV